MPEQAQGLSHRDLRSLILGILWTVQDCPDSSEPMRACRSCEAEVLAERLRALL